MNAGVGPAFFPVVQVGLSFLQTFETLSLERRFLCMADAGLDLTLAEKRALQTVLTVAQKFSLSLILFTR